MQKFWSLLLAGALGGLVVIGGEKLTAPEAAQPLIVQQQPAPVRQVNYGGANFDFTRAAEKAMPTVVHIKASESKQAAIQRQRQQNQTNPFRYFFGDDFLSPFDGQRSGTGSGVIYSSDGYIITNNHVVEFADDFLVTLHDNREFKARLVARDASTDMAVIKIDASDLPVIEIGNSDEVQVGEWALAVGNPFDLTSTVTAGIISAKGRDINIIKNGMAIESFIQTDAAVNPGNSGGALVDVNGRLIGINSAIATPNGTFAGYSFAIPVNLVTRIIDDLIKYGSFHRAYLGVDIAAMDSELAKEINVPFVQGVAILGIDPDGSAAKAGILEKDIITRINGKNVTGLPELREMIGRSKVGETITLTVMRNGNQNDVPVRLRTKTTG
ncbi:MAG: trypsin-like peptidase domain-containing protein [Lewinellaceae bacterium]|nr:trypsin-like peptidase domain-containing protein [Lewinellaceae bacterium]